MSLILPVLSDGEMRRADAAQEEREVMMQFAVP